MIFPFLKILIKSKLELVRPVFQKYKIEDITSQTNNAQKKHVLFVKLSLQCIKIH